MGRRRPQRSIVEQAILVSDQQRRHDGRGVQIPLCPYAGRLRLVTSLEIVVSNNGREELLKTTLPSAIRLLEMISTGVTPTPNSMEMESSSSTAAATENAEEQYEWVYTGRQESFREVTLSDGTVARLEFRL
uniref:Uncharacterized protein n=1 Tax=Moniliophthora roreri TaxID=221103 RepID=A0A0W0FX64_MONRR